MKVFLVSDTHGKIDRAITEINKYKDLDLVIHLGDYITDAKKIEKEINIPIAYVKGNLDSGNTGDNSQVIEIKGHSIYLTHGHKENVKYGLTKLYFTAQEHNCKVALFGHSHVPFHDTYNEMTLINPGSISEGRNGHKEHYAILDIIEGKIDVQFIEVN